MNTELFIARRLYGSGEKRISKPAVAIAQWGVAMGIIIMIASLCIVIGFKHEIRDKIIGFGGNIQVRNYEVSEYGEKPVTITNDETELLKRLPGVAHVQTFIQKAGLISVGNEFEGVLLKGIGANYDNSFFAEHIIKGEFPQFSDTTASNKIVLSQNLADRLRAGVGDKLNIYFMHDGIKARRMTISGIFNTNLNEIDNILAITDIYTTRRLNNWTDKEVTGVEISVTDYNLMQPIAENVSHVTDSIAHRNREMLYAKTVEEMNPSMFAWLDVLDQTVWIILVLVLGIAGFTMISGLLILILEKSNLIGILKAIGARNASIQKIFLYYGVLIIGKGMVYGNIIGLVLCFIQQKTRLIALEPQMYYMDSVPIEFSWLLAPLNIAMFIISVAMLVLPSMLISRIAPTKAIKFE